MAQASSYPLKTTPVNADELLGLDSAASSALKRFKLATDVAWTPVLTSSGTPPTLTYTDRVGISSRIGSLVYLHCYMLVNITAVGTGDLKISGIPYGSSRYCALHLGLSSAFNAIAPYAPWVNGWTIDFWQMGGTAYVQTSALRLGAGYLCVSGFYYV